MNHANLIHNSLLDHFYQTIISAVVWNMFNRFSFFSEKSFLLNIDCTTINIFMRIYTFPKFLFFTCNKCHYTYLKLKAKHFKYFSLFHTILNIKQKFAKTSSNPAYIYNPEPKGQQNTILY